MQLKKYLLLPVLVVLAFHFPVLLCDFAWDDVTLVQTNSLLASTDFLEFFSQDYGTHLGARNPVGYYRPFFVCVLSLLYRAGGPSPLLFHAFSLFLLCAASVLVPLACRAVMKKHVMLPVIAGCLYAAHPARSELASLVMSMPDLIVEMCCLGIVIAVLTFKRRAACGMTVTGLLALVAVTTKESAFFLLAGISLGAALSIFMKDRKVTGSLLVPLSIVPALGIGIILNLVAGISRPGLSAYLYALLTAGSASAIRIVLTAVRDILIPGTPTYIASVEATPSSLSSLAVVILICSLGVTAWRLCVNSLEKSLIFCWFAAGIFSLMLIGAVGIPYSQRYVPIAPAIIGMALAAGAFHSFSRHRLFTPLTIAYIITHGLFSLSGSAACRNNLTLFTYVANQQPELLYPRLILADRLFYEYRDYDRMEAYALEGIKIRPDSPETARLWKLLARKSLAAGDISNARKMLSSAERVTTANDAELLWLRAICLLEEGKPEAARPLLEDAVEMEPENVEYRYLLEQVKP